MTTPINLNKVRKQKTRAKKEQRAAENRIKYGRTKAQKAANKLEALRLSKKLHGDATKAD